MFLLVSVYYSLSHHWDINSRRQVIFSSFLSFLSLLLSFYISVFLSGFLNLISDNFIHMCNVV